VKPIGAIIALSALASAGQPDGIRYRDVALEAGLAEAKSRERHVLVVLWMGG
jgi:hypothetical protein